MKHSITIGLAALISSIAVFGAEPETKPASQWRSKPPADCPFKPSA
jgi:hypothetical protein